MENQSAHLVVTHHGIRTVESWQSRFELALRKGAQARNGQAPTVWPAENGYFSILSYALPFLRMRAVEEFERNLVTVLRERRWERVDFVAHSFGTYIVANALMRIAASEPELLKPLRVVITSGSVLPCRFAWHSLVRHAPDLRVVNDVAHNDWALISTRLIR